MNKKILFSFLFVFMVLLVGCSINKFENVNFNVSSDSEPLFVESHKHYEIIHKEYNNRSLSVTPNEKMIVVENDNKVTSVVYESGEYALDNNEKIKHYYINAEKIGEVNFNGKINLDKLYIYSGKIIVNDYDPSIIFENIGVKNTNFEGYFNKFLKNDLEKNFNKAISEIVNEKNISINEISTDDLSKKLDELIDLKQKKGVSLEIVFDSIG